MKRHSNHPARRRPGTGFTLVETLVAIGAVALLSVGIATIFQSVGRTVSSGKRISFFHQYATQIERQMRSDFAAMTREGFLVINHQYAVDPAGVKLQGATAPSLFEGQPASSKRPRRIDEILFFASGEFSSAREPIAPGVVPSASSAAVYYGHGAAWPSQPAGVQAIFNRPEANVIVGTTDSLVLGHNPGNATIETFPNRFASSWTLLRHVTLLTSPASTDTRYAPNGIYGLPPTSIRLIDRDLQIALQPASSSLFRSLERTFPDAIFGGGGATVRSTSVGTPVRNYRTTGLIDVATTNLDEIRSLSQTLNFSNLSEILVPSDVASAADLNAFREQQNQQTSGGFNSIPYIDPANIATPGNPDANALAGIHAWMRDVLPANSTGDAPVGPANPAYARIRSEPIPPDYFLNKPPVVPNDDLTRAWRRGDQLMLAASNFAPRCSEFIVEWSFGIADQSGQLVWYGGKSSPDVTDAAGQGTIRLYPGRFNTLGAATSWYTPYGTSPYPTVQNHQVRPELIYGPGVQTAAAQPLNLARATAHFGYIDPTYLPQSDDPLTIPWAWPRLVRVTMTLVDPSDDAVEETFQFVFDLPKVAEP